MKGKVFLVASVILIVSGYVQGQTPGRVPIFDQAGTGTCNAAGGNDCIDSVITQDTSGNIGIGTATPVAKLDVVGGNVELEDSTASTGNILKAGVAFISNFGINNTFFGKQAGNFTMKGTNNTAIGNSALGANTIGAFNSASGVLALYSNTVGSGNTAIGPAALYFNATGNGNTAIGNSALYLNTTGNGNTAIGAAANVSQGDLTNATAVGRGAVVDASNKIRLGDNNVTVVEGQVPYTFTSDRNQKENFQPVDGEQVLRKINDLSLTSWNYIGHDPKQFRHYGPVAQEFFAAFGHDSVGTIGSDTTINSGDMEGILMIAVQALEKRTAENAELKKRIEALEQAIKALQATKSGN